MAASAGVPPEALSLLRSDLIQWGLEECSTVADLLAVGAQKAAFICGRNIRVAEYYDFRPPLLIYDGQGGTVALVQNVFRDCVTLAAQVRAAVDSAVSLRQIAVEKAERETRSGKTPLIALQVEVVLLAEGAAASGAQDPIPGLLSEMNRTTGYLRLVGLSVLDAGKCGAFNQPALRRAFPWLMKAARDWFEKQSNTAGAELWRQPGESFRLQLNDYRLRGERSLTCEGNCALHLLHGHNGSGKSTYTEALELLMTSRIERVEASGEKNYFLAVRHRQPEFDDVKLKTLAGPSVSLWTGTKDTPRTVVEVADGDRVVTRQGGNAANLRATSFRLDSVFIDKLARGTVDSRAMLFLNAFSPGDAELLPQLEGHRANLRSALAALPVEVRAAAPATEDKLLEWIAAEFGWLTEESQPSADTPAPAHGTAFASALLPLNPREIELAGRIHPPLKSAAEALRIARSSQDLTGVVSRLEVEFTAILAAAPAALKAMQCALQVLLEFQTWTATGQVERGAALAADLDRWLELQALLDLNSKYLDVVSTMDEAYRLGWAPAPEDVELLPQAPLAADLTTRLEARKSALTREVSDARVRVQAWQQQPGAHAAGVPPRSAARTWLTPFEIQCLSRTGEWLESVQPSPEPLGTAFARALAQDTTVTFGKSWVGSPPGLDAAIAELRELIAAAERLIAADAGSGGVRVRLQQLQQLAGEAAKLKLRTSALAESFFVRLAGGDPLVRASLVDAFNELLALITPARWNYRDLELQAQINTGTASLGIATVEGARADLLLNTAELNGWALALFLLLACRLPNPMRVLILDDPLQNMDELSVVTLARGLGRLMRIFPKGWMILGFFHGEQNVDMIRQETECNVYQLPWLQSRMESADPLEKIGPLSTAPAQMQKLEAAWFAEPAESAAR